MLGALAPGVRRQPGTGCHHGSSPAAEPRGIIPRRTIRFPHQRHCRPVVVRFHELVVGGFLHVVDVAAFPVRTVGQPVVPGFHRHAVHQHVAAVVELFRLFGPFLATQTTEILGEYHVDFELLFPLHALDFLDQLAALGFAQHPGLVGHHVRVGGGGLRDRHRFSDPRTNGKRRARDKGTSSDKTKSVHNCHIISLLA